jgi:hypothetical protein
MFVSSTPIMIFMQNWHPSKEFRVNLKKIRNHFFVHLESFHGFFSVFFKFCIDLCGFFLFFFFVIFESLRLFIGFVWKLTGLKHFIWILIMFCIEIFRLIDKLCMFFLWFLANRIKISMMDAEWNKNKKLCCVSAIELPMNMNATNFTTNSFASSQTRMLAQKNRQRIRPF